MSRSLGKKMAVALGLAALGIAAGSTASCADNAQSIFIRQVLDRPLGDCIPKNDPTAVTLAGGSLDVSLANSYSAVVLIGNQLLGRGDPKTTKSETMRVSILGAEVRLVDGSGVQRHFFTVQANGLVDPTTGSDPGFGLTIVQLIPATIGKGFIAEARQHSFVITANFKVFGRTLGGTDVSTVEYVFPISICYGCLVSFSGEISDAKVGQSSNCRKAVKTGDPRTYCLQGQDHPVGCQWCQDLNVCTVCSSFVPCPQGGACIGATADTGGYCALQ